MHLYNVRFFKKNCTHANPVWAVFFPIVLSFFVYILVLNTWKKSSRALPGFIILFFFE